MRRITTLLFGAFFGGLAVVLAFNYHIVRTPDTLLIVAKQHATLTDTYADVRSWSVNDWNTHNILSQNIIKAGHGDLITKSVAGGLIDDVLKNIGTKK
jgi:hypothetical protein